LANTYRTHGEYNARPTTEADIGAIAASMRPADAYEVKVLSGQDPTEALTSSYELSQVCRTLSYQDTPLIMYGTVEMPDGSGCVWGLGSTEIEKHVIPFLRVSKTEVDILQGNFPLIFNFVHAANHLHLKWVDYVGFDINEPVEHVTGELVRPIHRRI